MQNLILVQRMIGKMLNNKIDMPTVLTPASKPSASKYTMSSDENTMDTFGSHISYETHRHTNSVERVVQMDYSKQ